VGGAVVGLSDDYITGRLWTGAPNS